MQRFFVFISAVLFIYYFIKLLLLLLFSSYLLSFLYSSSLIRGRHGATVTLVREHLGKNQKLALPLNDNPGDNAVNVFVHMSLHKKVEDD